MDRFRVAIVIPALNEEETIADVVEKVSSYGMPIVVDDGSIDETGPRAVAAGAQLVRHETNRGYDGALSSGFQRAFEAGCTYVVTIDADGQHNPSQIAQFVRLLDAGNDLVIGRRNRLQRAAETVFDWISRTLWNVSDPLCGMKAYRIQLYESVGHFDSLRSVGTELALRSVARGCRFAQVPVITRERRDQPRFGRSLSANFRIMRAVSILVMLHFTGRLA